MTRALLCVLLSAAVLFVGLFAAKLCSANHARGEFLHRMQRSNEMQAAYNDWLRIEAESHQPGGQTAIDRARAREEARVEAAQ